MLLEGCLNGARSRAEHPALPVTPEEVAVQAVAAVAAGAGALHLHPKRADGTDTSAPGTVAALLRAVRAAVPGTPVGVTTGAWMGPAAGLQADIASWTELPDFASVNWNESGAADTAELLLSRGIELEIGVHTPAAVRSWQQWPLRRRTLRLCLEVLGVTTAQDGLDAADASLAALAADDAVTVLLHSENIACWPVLMLAVGLGHDTRIGLEDTLLLPDGSPAGGNGDLVAAARAIVDGVRDRGATVSG